MLENKSVKAYALDQLREYLIINDVEVTNKDDFVKIYLDMKNGGYFYKADVKGALAEVRQAFSELADAYEKDADVLEKDLIFGGAKRALEKISSNKAKR